MFKSPRVRSSILAFFVVPVFLFLPAAPAGTAKSPDKSLPGNAVEIKLTIRLRIDNERIVRVLKSEEGYHPRLPRNSKVHLTIVEELQNPAPAGYDINDHIEIEFTHADLTAIKPAILIEPYFPPSFRTAGDREPILKMESDLVMDLAGRKYSLKINRYAGLEDKLRGKNPATVYEGNFSTYRLYYLGFNAGWLLPLDKNFYSYTLYHTDPADASDGSLQTIRRTRAYQTKAVLFASFYPGGIEPEGPLSWKNIHLNLGTELSTSIMKSLYIGAGYDFRFFSVNLFYGITKADVLPDEYSDYINQTITNKKITSLPLLEKWDKFVGFAISFPFSLAAIFGKLIGL